MIKVLPKENDEIEFIMIVQKILNGFVKNFDSDKVYIIKIDNWFDSKWRQFAGKMLGIAGFFSYELVVPPFNPNRVVEQICFQKTGGIYEERDTPNIHFYQPSEENLSRKISGHYESKMFIWFSGNTQNTFHGSVMIYQFDREKQNSWYISFLKKDSWQIYKTDQISRNEVLNLMK